MINFCTLFDSNYLDKGLALYKSLQMVKAEYTLFVFCFDEESFRILNDMKLPNLEVVHYSKIETPELLKLKEGRTKGEYCWTCTPVIIEYVLDNYQVESCTYIDSDLFFFSDPAVLFSEIRESRANTVITEHRFPNNKWGKKWLKKSGKYCVEFNYFDQSNNAREALNWWKEKCFEWCYALYEPERMGDQKYLEKFPEKFKGVHELQHLGGGVAPWNVKQYRVKSNSDTIVLEEIKGNGEEISLVFYHFQNLKYLSHNIVNINSGTHDRKIKQVIYKPYLKIIKECRRMLKDRYGIDFAVNKSYSSNKIKAFIQKYIMKFKIKSFSDIINLNKI